MNTKLTLLIYSVLGLAILDVTATLFAQNQCNISHCNIQGCVVSEVWYYGPTADSVSYSPAIEQVSVCAYSSWGNFPGPVWPVQRQFWTAGSGICSSLSTTPGFVAGAEDGPPDTSDARTSCDDSSG